MIDVINLTKRYDKLLVLDEITETIHEGERVVILGPSGSGKSTFLRCLNCMEDPTSGSIIFDGEDLTDLKVDINLHRQKMGMVFQQFNLFNNKTVLENITLAPLHVGLKKIKGRAARAAYKAEVIENAHRLLQRIGRNTLIAFATQGIGSEILFLSLWYLGISWTTWADWQVLFYCAAELCFTVFIISVPLKKLLPFLFGGRLKIKKRA